MARWKLHKNATSYFEQIVEAAPYKNSRMVTYLRSQKPCKTDKTSGTLMKKQASLSGPLWPGVAAPDIV